jgi:HSP20 family protein
MLMRTDPYRELDRLAQALGTPSRPAAMPIDAFRRGDEFIVELDLPGVDAGSIDLTVERNVLTVHAQRVRSDDGGEVELLVGERPHGTFSRQMFLGDTLDTSAIEADYTDGVLTLRLPVAERAKPRRVPINHARASRAIDTTESSTETGTDQDRTLASASVGTG